MAKDNNYQLSVNEIDPQVGQQKKLPEKDLEINKLIEKLIEENTKLRSDFDSIKEQFTSSNKLIERQDSMVYLGFIVMLFMLGGIMVDIYLSRDSTMKELSQSIHLLLIEKLTK